MRSSKNRSRSKSNRQRSIGNIVNRVFDSSGPEGKVRGTPQQIIDKYLQLARDAQLSNDRVAEQNFLQHAEHYTRMLGEAMREQQREQEQRQAQQGSNGGAGGDRQNPQQGGQNGQQNRDRYDNRGDRDRDDNDQPDVAMPVTADADDGPGLVETPEMRSRREQNPKAQPAEADAQAQPERGPRPPRAPRKPRPRREDADKADTPGETETPVAE
jgi:hypothetical protein